jgi:phage shock protein PspC (stress-responsive transcriptional regulator)
MLMNRRLYRSRTDTIIGGVASGLAHYMNADPALVRIAWAILVPLTGGIAFLGYIVGWIVIPEEPRGAPMPVAPATTGDLGTVAGEATTEPTTWTPPEPETRSSAGGNAGIIVGLALVALGAWFLLRDYLPSIDWSLVWPVIIVGVGVLILVGAMRRREG